MVTPSKVVGPLVAYLERNSLPHLPSLLQDVLTTVLLPLGVAVLAFGGTLSLVKSLYRWWVPPSVGHKYIEARLLYRKGHTDQALQEWAALQAYGPAYLSRACHALYVEWDAPLTLQILRLQARSYEMMKLDAQALQGPSGAANRSMMGLNARLAKQEHLGINSE